jgi:nitroreductase
MRVRFVVVRDSGTKSKLQTLYADGMRQLYSAPAPPPDPNDPAGPPDPAAVKTSGWLTEHLADVPVLIFVLGLPGFGSTSFPIAWQLCLAARAYGLGTTLTNVLRFHQEETDRLIGIPEDSDWEFHAMIPVGKPLGNWGLAKRPPVNRFTYDETFGNLVDWEVDQPCWNPAS